MVVACPVPETPILSLQDLEFAEELILSDKGLPGFWGFKLVYTPRLEWGGKTEEFMHNEKKVTISPEELADYGIDMAPQVGQKPAAGLLYFMGHSMNHFFAHKLCDDMETYSQWEISTQSHKARVEAFVAVATEHLMKIFNYDGPRLTAGFLENWRKNGGDPELIKNIRSYINVFRKCSPTELIEYVKGYGGSEPYQLFQEMRMQHSKSK